MKRIICIIILFLPVVVVSQNQLRFGILPEIAASYSGLGRWSLTTKVESMHFLYEKQEDAGEFRHSYDQTDLQFFGNYRLALRWRVSAGYQYRFEPGDNSHRLIQQITTKQSFNHLSLGHRLRFDESFYKHESPKFRIRYRLSSEFALKGSKLDVKEFYLKASIEALYSMQDTHEEFEGRLSFMPGYFFANRNKLEAGFDYRTDNYIEGLNNHNLWFKIAYFLNF